LNSIIGLEIRDLVRTRQFGTTQMVQDISQFTEKMDEPTEDPYTGVISLGRSKTDTIPTSKTASGIGGNGNSVRTEKNLNGSNHEQEDRSSTLELKGTAVFKGSRFVGVLNEPETQGFLLVKGGLKNSVVTLGCGSGDTGNVGVEINDSKATLTPEFSQGKPSMSVSISVNADIGQYTCKKGHLNTEKVGELNQQFERVMKQQVEDTLNVAQKAWQTDIFGFGRAFYRKDPVQWKPMAPNWKNGILKEMDVKVKVTANINRYGLRKEPTYVNETR